LRNVGRFVSSSSFFFPFSILFPFSVNLLLQHLESRHHRVVCLLCLHLLAMCSSWDVTWATGRRHVTAFRSMKPYLPDQYVQTTSRCKVIVETKPWSYHKSSDTDQAMQGWCSISTFLLTLLIPAVTLHVGMFSFEIFPR